MFKNKVFPGLWLSFLILCFTATGVFAESECEPVEKKPVKVEGYISKQFKKQGKAISKEFAEMGHTRVVLRPFPMGETAKVVAIGRCVPAYIAQHALKLALQYTGGVEQIVNQTFVHAHWVGIGTTMFDEPSQQNVSSEQVQKLLQPGLTTDEFQALYRKLSIQDATVPYFGLTPPNAKKVQ